MSIVNETDVAAVSAELQKLQKQRVWLLKTRNMQMNRLRASVAGRIGYTTGLSESERKKIFVQAEALILQIHEDTIKVDDVFLGIMVMTTYPGIQAQDDMKDQIEVEMKGLTKTLPIVSWLGEPEQKGFGLLMLAKVIGECGDLRNYANPAKVWRRMGCAPYTKDGVTQMGSTWKRSNKKGSSLHKSDWTEFGYSPRRRSEAFLIGDGIVKQNGEGPYRQRYDSAKVKSKEKHPEWWICPTCKGSKLSATGKKCSYCKGTGEVKMHGHLHAMLLATKMLLKNLWIEWNDHPEYTPDW